MQITTPTPSYPVSTRSNKPVSQPTPTPPSNNQPATPLQLPPLQPNHTVIAAAPGVETASMYMRLEQFLAAGEWRKADEQTRDLLVHVAKVGKEKSDYYSRLSANEIEAFSCSDLRKIDQLWIKYSDGRFGWSVQNAIYLQTRNQLGTYNEDIYARFGHRIGWRKNESWLYYNDLTFN